MPPSRHRGGHKRADGVAPVTDEAPSTQVAEPCVGKGLNDLQQQLRCGDAKVELKQRQHVLDARTGGRRHLARPSPSPPVPDHLPHARPHPGDIDRLCGQSLGRPLQAAQQSVVGVRRTQAPDHLGHPCGRIRSAPGNDRSREVGELARSSCRREVRPERLGAAPHRMLALELPGEHDSPFRGRRVLVDDGQERESITPLRVLEAVRGQHALGDEPGQIVPLDRSGGVRRQQQVLDGPTRHACPDEDDQGGGAERDAVCRS